jgi:8-oxo-dGTP pyrophosphatase MutT (NUDIX family)
LAQPSQRRRRGARLIPIREVAVFVTRRDGRDILLLHRSRAQGAYWHVVAGGVEPGETFVAAAERELREETGLVAEVTDGVEVAEFADALTGEPADQDRSDEPSVVEVRVKCFRVAAPDAWEPTLDWEHDDHEWCDPGRAFGALRWPGTARALRELFGMDHL